MAGPDHSTNSLYGELKRRKVVRTCVLYIVLCWGVLQVGDILYPAMGWEPELASRNALYIAILGFPVTLAIAWFFQISSGGIVRTTAFVERRVLSNISPINDHRRRGVTHYFRKEEAHPVYNWILSAETGPLAGLSFGVTHALVIGRALDCDVAIVSQHVSRQHARLDLEGEQLTVEDLGSANGTMVNSKKIEGVSHLHHEDELRFYDIVFRVSQSYSSSRSEMDAKSQTTVIDSVDLESTKVNQNP